MLLPTFLAASAIPLVSAAALQPRQEPRQACIVTPPAVTKSTYTNVDVFYTTSTVTVYALSTPALQSALPEPPSQGSDSDSDSTPAEPALQPSPPQSQQPANPAANPAPAADPPAPSSCADLTTAPTPTTTVTKTYTYSHAARATHTASACSSGHMYNGSIALNTKQALFAIDQPRAEAFPALLTPEACCNQCFQGTCMYFSFDGWERDGSGRVDGCVVYWSDGRCPNGWRGTESLRMEGAEDRGTVGLGPCGVEVGYFVNG